VEVSEALGGAEGLSPEATPAMSSGGVPAPAVDIYAVLDAQGIRYERFDHVPVFTCDEAERAVTDTAAAHTKNLFLRDKKGQRHWLLVTLCAKAVDLKQVAEQIGADKLSLGSPERLAKHLGVTPGAVTILALVNDTAHTVALVMDQDVWQADAIRAHPLVNTATLVISQPDIRRFLERTGHNAQVIRVVNRTPAPPPS
jgi:Ala-tRNA(Pro) deacylase